MTAPAYFSSLSTMPDATEFPDYTLWSTIYEYISDPTDDESTTTLQGEKATLFVDYADGYNFTTDSSFDPRPYYRIVVPIMLFFCIVSIVTNIIIVTSVRWVRRSLSPTLCFSISLAAADAEASLLIGIGLVTNSYLPVVFNIQLGENSNCIAITIEGFRLAGMMASVLHLLALAINHYIGIIRPLHYASTITRRNALISIVIMWVLPITFFFVYFSSVPNGGFQSPHCDNIEFFLLSQFRIVLSSIFFFPMVLMMVTYIHIFVIVRNHHRGLVQYQTTTNQLNKNVKAVITTLLILGTYFVGWMPAVSFSLLTCEDCLIPVSQIDQAVVFHTSVGINTMIIIKGLVDPIIYAARMKEIRVALQRMRRQCLGGGEDPGIFPSFRSRNDTTATSLRMQSVYYRREKGDPLVFIYETKDGATTHDNKQNGK